MFRLWPLQRGRIQCCNVAKQPNANEKAEESEREKEVRQRKRKTFNRITDISTTHKFT